jgi:hypothetical protein
MPPRILHAAEWADGRCRHVSMVKKFSRQQGVLSQRPQEHLNFGWDLIFQRYDHLLDYVTLSNDPFPPLSQFSLLIFILTIILYDELTEISPFGLHFNPRNRPHVVCIQHAWRERSTKLKISISRKPSPPNFLEVS